MKYYTMTPYHEKRTDEYYRSGLRRDKNGIYICDIHDLGYWLRYEKAFLWEIIIPDNVEIINKHRYVSVKEAIFVNKRELWTTKTMKFLIKQGIDINANSGVPFRGAIDSQSFEIVKMFIENGANIHSNNDRALRCSFHYCDCIVYDAVKYLVEHGADVHVDDEVMLKESIYRGYYYTARLLIEYGANINALNAERLNIIKKLLPFKTKYKLNLSKEELTQSTILQYLSWAKKQLTNTVSHAIISKG